MRTQRKRLTYALSGAVLASNLVGIVVGSHLGRPVTLSQDAIAANPVVSRPDPQALQRNAENFRAVSKLVGPSVLTIKASAGVEKAANRPRGRGNPGPLNPDSFEDLLEQFGFGFQRPPGFRGPESGPREASGSGFVIDRRGYVVTNHHVIKGATKITVLSPDDESVEIPAKVVGSDPKTDLAVLKIESAESFPAVEWADSDKVEVGDSAIAIGSPFMLTHSVTAGIVSAKGRNASALFGADFGYEMLQTDAAINPGNSGGPLCTADGRVMGVNTAIFTQSGGYMGIGFAIPSNVARGVVDALIRDGKVTRGWLGVSIQPADKATAKELGVAGAVLVHEVQPASPAQKAGLKAGDAIVQIGDETVTKVMQVQRAVAAVRPGEIVRVKVIGYVDKKARTLDVKIGEQPSEGKVARGGEDKLGAIVEPVPGGQGVVVHGVAPQSAAERAGLQPGDRILSVNRKAVHNEGDYRAQVDNTERWNLVIERDGRTLFVTASAAG